MRHLFMTALAIVAFAPLDAAAEDASGFYAGIYGTAGPRNTTEYSDISFFGIVNETGTESSPPLDNPGIRPELFTPNRDGFQNYYPDATSISFSSAAIEGLMTSSLGVGAGVVAGYSFGNGFRVEADASNLTFSARRADFHSTDYASAAAHLVDGEWDWTDTFASQTPTDRSSDVSALTFGGSLLTTSTFLLLNGYYDVSMAGGVSAYLGGGLGVALLSSHSRFQPDCGCLSGYSVDSSAIVPAAQLGVGLRIPISDPMTMDIGYRYKVAGSSALTSTQLVPDYQGDGTEFVGDAYTQTGIIGIHAVQAGLTVAFQ